MSVSQPPSDSQAIVDSLLGEATEACRTEAERARRLNEILSRCEAIREQQAKFAKESARGVPIDTPDASLAFLRGELGDVYPLPSLAPLWVAAQSLNLGGVPRWPGEPQTGPEAFEDLDALSDWCRRQMGRPAVLLPAAGGRTAPTSALPEKPATNAEGDAERPDGVEGGCWLWWAGKRHDIPKGNVYKLVAFMWVRNSAAYDDLIGQVFDDPVEAQTNRSLVHKVNKALSRIGIPWKLSADSVSRQISKKLLD